jgi:hypothetical protein
VNSGDPQQGRHRFTERYSWRKSSAGAVAVDQVAAQCASLIVLNALARLDEYELKDPMVQFRHH